MSTHKGVRLGEAIKTRGAEVMLLLRDSPDCHPIEGAWGKLKAYLRQAATRARKAPRHALARGLARSTAAHACGCFQHAGYNTA